jgi:hypothetical protein
MTKLQTAAVVAFAGVLALPIAVQHTTLTRLQAELATPHLGTLSPATGPAPVPRQPHETEGQEFARLRREAEDLRLALKQSREKAEPGSDQPPGYNIHLGEGFYGGKGYRVVSRRLLATNTVELTVDFEKNDGTSFRRDRLLIEHNGHWRLQPMSVTRAQ